MEKTCWTGDSRASLSSATGHPDQNIPKPMATASVTSGRFSVWTTAFSSALLPILMPILKASSQKLTASCCTLAATEVIYYVVQNGYDRVNNLISGGSRANGGGSASALSNSTQFLFDGPQGARNGGEDGVNVP
jgi:hypothetical protein